MENRMNGNTYKQQQTTESFHTQERRRWRLNLCSFSSLIKNKTK